MKLDKIDKELLEILKTKEDLHSKKMEQVKIMFANVSCLKDIKTKELLMNSIRNLSNADEKQNADYYELWYKLASLINRARKGDLQN